ncbi:hypothetical protein ACFL47_08270 [Candidatus Latescibacterota bacterium]
MMKRAEMIFSLLDPLAIEELIHRPINNAAEAFDYIPPNPLTHNMFNTLVDRFARHIYNLANLPCLGPTARHEGIWLLENNYRRDESNGYDGAYIDALDNEFGIGFILEAITEIIREIEHQKHITSVLTQYVDPTDRQLKVRMGAYLMKTLAPYIHESVSSLPPSQLANEWETLLSIRLRYLSEIKSTLF